MRGGHRGWVGAVVVLVALLGCAPMTDDGGSSLPAGVPSTHPIPSAPPAQDPAPGIDGSVVPLRRAAVVRTIDGDTIEVRLGARSERVRLIGVDTPERGQRWYAEASAFTAARLPAGRVVWLEIGVEPRDRYGRLLAYVWREPPMLRVRAEIRDKMHNAALLRRGYAVLLTIPPNVDYVEHLRRFQAAARAGELGIWSVDEQRQCDASYPDVCIPPPPPDLDCGDTAYRSFRVTGSDPHRFDGDGNGRGCES